MSSPLLTLTLLSLLAAADPSLYTHPKHAYRGCYNETANLPDTTGDRALSPGTSLMAPGKMTVELCLDFCASDNQRYAGVEYSRYAYPYPDERVSQACAPC